MLLQALTSPLQLAEAAGKMSKPPRKEEMETMKVVFELLQLAKQAKRSIARSLQAPHIAGSLPYGLQLSEVTVKTSKAPERGHATAEPPPVPIEENRGLWQVEFPGLAAVQGEQ